MSVLQPVEQLSLAQLEIKFQSHSHTLTTDTFMSHHPGERRPVQADRNPPRVPGLTGGWLAGLDHHSAELLANYWHAESLNCTNHAVLQTLVQSLDPRSTPQPCSVPIHLSPVSMLYYDNNNNIVLCHYQDMETPSCPTIRGKAVPFRPTVTLPEFQASLVAVSLNPLQCRSRQKRSAVYLPVMPRNVCKPRRLYIDFKDVGWQDWIIAPQGYLANYCHGECPFPLSESLNCTNHAVLQTLVHSLDPRSMPQPCCVSIHLSPVSMLYYDNNNNIVLRHYQDMVLDECGCR
ncbi:unnamed protein product [Coregonus sp. 'balchen']|nr:unnamed protein product [Coregonus sp. 'balchen']